VNPRLRLVNKLGSPAQTATAQQMTMLCFATLDLAVQSWTEPTSSHVLKKPNPQNG
jgi:hypothetical protein